MIQFDDVHVSYGKHRVLTGLGFVAADGRVTALVGPNGAGKSTAFKVLLGLLPPDQGAALIDGLPYAEQPTPGLALGTYLGPQHIPGALTGRGFLQWTADLLAVSNNGIDSYLAAVGLTPAANRKIASYSLGMRQRLGVAACFLGEPQNLMLDEPVNGLDIEGVRWLREYLLHAAGQGRCVLLSSHLLSELELVADDVVMLGGGRASRQGTMKELRGGDIDVVVVISDHNQRLAEELRTAGMAVSIVEDAIHVRHPSVNAVAAAAAASSVPLQSVAHAVRRLEDVYLEQTQLTDAAVSAGKETRA